MSETAYEWLITQSPYVSPFLVGTKKFGEENPLFLIDQYSGRRPALMNDEFIKTGTLSFEMYPSALLDSNLASQVHAAANGGRVNDGFKDFLHFVANPNWDYSLHFYYIEHASKTDRSDFLANAISRTKALLTLHTMDVRHFLDSGYIVTDPKVVEYYLTNELSSSLEQVAEKRVNNFLEKFIKIDVLEHIELIEIALLKMVLIRKFELVKALPKDQLIAFVAFLDRDLNARIAREVHLGMHYFFDQAGRFLGVQPNTPWDRAFKMIRSTAWDMYYVRFPEYFLQENPTQLCVSYLATQEKQLHNLARLFTVEKIVGYSDNRPVQPIIGYSMRDLPKSASEIVLPDRVSTGKKRSIPSGLRDSLYAELRRLLGA